MCDFLVPRLQQADFQGKTHAIQASIDRRANKPQGKLAQVLVRPEAGLARPKTPSSIAIMFKMRVKMVQMKLEHRGSIFHAFPSPEVIPVPIEKHQECTKHIHATGSELAQV